MRLNNRLKKVELAAHPPAAQVKTFHCIIDGEACVMSELDFAFAVHVQHKQGEKGSFAGYRPIEAGFSPDELAQVMADIQAEYNSPTAIAKREAEYLELRRIGELRRQDFLCGRPMDTHPLPWEKGYKNA